MSTLHDNILLILDDREIAAGDVRGVVGARRFGDIMFQRRRLVDHFRAGLPAWAASRLIHLRGADDLPALRAALEASGEECGVCVIAGRAGFAEAERLLQLVERLPYAEEDFTDRLYQPLLVFLRNAHRLVEQWQEFSAAPLHRWELAWHGCQRIASVQPLDLARMRDFLSFISGATAARHFNQVELDAYYYTKSSADVAKMRAEYAFYGLVPEAMRPWLVQPFDYQERDGRASYRTLRYYLADAALQWVHGAFEADAFDSFVERLLFFMAERPRRACGKAESAAVARALFVTKLEQRAEQFLATDAGRRIDALAASASPHLALAAQVERFRRLYQRHEKSFAFDHMAIGHGDPCFSNVLYDQQRYLLRLIDPRGAVSEQALWTHPLYDICKLSHSALGDYDFINNNLYRIGFDDGNALQLHLEHSNHASLKPVFQRQLKAAGHDERIVRLGEASLFLSMLPLHLDVPNKVMAFLLKADAILDLVENQ
jgi:hypothetical protein